MRHVALLGTGLIGGSIGLGLRRGAPDVVVSGYDLDESTLARAVELGAVSVAGRDPATTVAGADVVVLAVPLGAVETTLDALGSAVAADAVITDVASAKAAVVAAGEKSYGERFVGGHPMSASIP